MPGSTKGLRIYVFPHYGRRILVSATRKELSAIQNERRQALPVAVPPLDTRGMSLADLKAAFLERYAEIGTISLAAKHIGMGRRRIYDWRQADPDFDEAVRDAEDAFKESVKLFVWDRAFNGWYEDIYARGVVVGQVHKHSDNLIMFATKQLMPSFRENAPVRTDESAAPQEITFSVMQQVDSVIDSSNKKEEGE